MTRSIFVCDIKLASILVGLGIPRRESDPVTCEIEKIDGKDVKRFRFWFDVSSDDDARKAQELMDAYSRARNWEEFTLDAEHPLYYMKGVLENRDAYLNWIKNDVKPLRIVKHGSKIVMITETASRSFKDKMKQHL